MAMLEVPDFEVEGRAMEDKRGLQLGVLDTDNILDQVAQSLSQILEHLVHWDLMQKTNVQGSWYVVSPVEMELLQALACLKFVSGKHRLLLSYLCRAPMHNVYHIFVPGRRTVITGDTAPWSTRPSSTNTPRSEEGMLEPQRIRKLLTWCGERALSEKPPHGSRGSSARKGVLYQRTAMMLSADSSLSN
ncbi:hypothetical protein CONLIGDRAFT_685877 [Coniochaeta ligniaria NRRL 30616]|uniref:Uncharacterized protein n=1 Tax=Coniochaeta ligniaria NRRL 30616 TaxID=1408157 RepID=A0A1J7IAC9_9PEZI|nr:hypothetical protein CONLIGDRAFT_685877 [Coniochaeta ligniaria NRRL 30616]